MYNKTILLKSAVIKSNNTSNYYIRLLGRWPILQFFGKPLTGNTLDIPSTQINNTSAEILNPIINKNQFMKCDEYGIFGIYDSDIQQIFPFYATNNGDIQLPVACMKRNGELIINPNNTYIGLYDGYLNDNLNSFSVKLHSTENWVYNNGDNADSHPLHFHLTSGFSGPENPNNSNNLVNSKRNYNPLIYSRDIFQIGPQESIGFYLTWPYYASDETTNSPNIKGIGGVIHCHFLKHNDSNSMIIKYYVEK